jgi:DNA modification methylase
LHIYSKDNRKALPAHSEEFIKSVSWSVWTLPVSSYRKHPCSFPEKLAQNVIQLYSNPGDTIFDPFAGAFTTAIAAAALQRRWIACEISDKYCRTARERLDSAIQKENDHRTKKNAASASQTLQPDS